MREYEDSYVEGLIHNCTLDEDKKLFCEKYLIDAEYDSEINSMVEYILQHQKDRISCGENYSQTDIKYKLNKILSNEY